MKRRRATSPSPGTTTSTSACARLPVRAGHAVGWQTGYGATTGFGPLVTFDGSENQAAQSDNALQHLAAGQGRELPPGVVRATMLVRTWSLARGVSGISPSALDALCAALETDFTPVVPGLRWHEDGRRRRAGRGRPAPPEPDRLRRSVDGQRHLGHERRGRARRGVTAAVPPDRGAAHRGAGRPAGCRTGLPGPPAAQRVRPPRPSAPHFERTRRGRGRPATGPCRSPTASGACRTSWARRCRLSTGRPTWWTAISTVSATTPCSSRTTTWWLTAATSSASPSRSRETCSR
ncbi:Aromatic amino acid lyase [Lentzea xinjiangensis]|uniref:Aromatic amino acid lyase n=1 Tax=Lentzea xinjiangensis TaxID=402600 RepID=A0A1H9WF66_9PSEU|nr:Aromatic amino acid lyase [Lentzea xinjiangensis]